MFMLANQIISFARDQSDFQPTVRFNANDLRSFFELPELKVFRPFYHSRLVELTGLLSALDLNQFGKFQKH